MQSLLRCNGKHSRCNVTHMYTEMKKVLWRSKHVCLPVQRCAVKSSCC